MNGQKPNGGPPHPEWDDPPGPPIAPAIFSNDTAACGLGAASTHEPVFNRLGSSIDPTGRQAPVWLMSPKGILGPTG